jgi:secretion/DNA translocation related TadE-like protein
MAQVLRQEPRDRDRGSATIWVLAFSGLIMCVALVGVVRTVSVLARHEVERAADLAALAAAEQIGRVGNPCTAAARIASANKTALASCAENLDPSGRSGSVVVTITQRVRLPITGMVQVTARSRAGRLPS